MTVENIEISVMLPRLLWEQLLSRAKTEDENESTLLVQAIEKFLREETSKLVQIERLERECKELATMEFGDVGSEDEWLIVQNEALHNVEADFR